jgi:hypothetical protein
VSEHKRGLCELYCVVDMVLWPDQVWGGIHTDLHVDLFHLIIDHTMFNCCSLRDILLIAVISLVEKHSYEKNLCSFDQIINSSQVCV